MREHGLTINDYEALLRLLQADDRRLKRVEPRRSLLLTPSGVTRLLDGLSGGATSRKDRDSDARVTYAVLTDAGYEKLAEASGLARRADLRFFEQRFEDDEPRRSPICSAAFPRQPATARTAALLNRLAR